LPDENRDTNLGVVIGWRKRTESKCLRKGKVTLTSSAVEEQTGIMTAVYGNKYFKGHHGDPLLVNWGKKSYDPYVLAGLTSQNTSIITKITSEHTDWIKAVCGIND
jgi:hypothetical protein